MDKDSSPTITIYAGEAAFPLGVLAITAGARETLTPVEVMRAIQCHSTGDWGDLGEEDREENALALWHGYRLFSVYEREDGDSRLYVITEADRSATTVLLPDEY